MVPYYSNSSKLTLGHTNISLAGLLPELGYRGRCRHCWQCKTDFLFLSEVLGKGPGDEHPFQGKVTAQRCVPAPSLCYRHAEPIMCLHTCLGAPSGLREQLCSVLSGNNYRLGWALAAHSGPVGSDRHYEDLTGGNSRFQGPPGKDRSAPLQ